MKYCHIMLPFFVLRRSFSLMTIYSIQDLYFHISMFISKIVTNRVQCASKAKTALNCNSNWIQWLFLNNIKVYFFLNMAIPFIYRPTKSECTLLFRINFTQKLYLAFSVNIAWLFPRYFSMSLGYSFWAN